MTIIEHKGQKWRDAGFADWYFSYEGDIYQGLIIAIQAFENIFMPEKFSYDPFGSGIYDRENTPWIDIKNIREIKEHINQNKKNAYVFGKIKIIKNGEEQMIEGIRFGGSVVRSSNYNEISISVETDDWLREYTDIRSHEAFNQSLKKMKQVLRGRVINYGGYEGIANGTGFDLEKIKEIRKKYGK